MYLRPASSTTAWVIGVSMPPGCTLLTRIFSAPFSSAATFVMPRTANLLPVYAPQNNVPPSPSVDDRLTIEPPPARFIAGIACFIPRNVPIRLMSMIWRSSSSGVLSIALNFRIPALFTRTSTRPYSRSVSATRDSQPGSSVTSWCTKLTRSPSSSASVLPSSSRMSDATTVAPASCSRRTVQAPMPRLPPVTIATLPTSEMLSAIDAQGGAVSSGIGFVASYDPHREELRTAAVRMTERCLRAVDLVLAGHAAHLQRGLGEPAHAGGADRVRRHDAAGRVDGQVAVKRRTSVVDHLPAGALVGEAEVLHPHRLVPGERHVDLGSVDVAARIGDAGLRVDVLRAVTTGVRVDDIAAGAHRRLAAYGGAVDPRRRVGGALGGVLVGEHDRAGAVGGRTGLEVADRIPQHRRLAHHLLADVRDLQIG